MGLNLKQTLIYSQQGVIVLDWRVTAVITYGQFSPRLNQLCVKALFALVWMRDDLVLYCIYSVTVQVARLTIIQNV